jgi:hypothetical protein
LIRHLEATLPKSPGRKKKQGLKKIHDDLFALLLRREVLTRFKGNAKNAIENYLVNETPFRGRTKDALLTIHKRIKQRLSEPTPDVWVPPVAVDLEKALDVVRWVMSRGGPKLSDRGRATLALSELGERLAAIRGWVAEIETLPAELAAIRVRLASITTPEAAAALTPEAAAALIKDAKVLKERAATLKANIAAALGNK